MDPLQASRLDGHVVIVTGATSGLGVGPATSSTEMTEGGREQLEENVERNSMLGRFGTQEELDPALIYLLSKASCYVTGTSLVVDGGVVAL